MIRSYYENKDKEFKKSSEPVETDLAYKRVMGLIFEAYGQLADTYIDDENWTEALENILKAKKIFERRQGIADMMPMQLPDGIWLEDPNTTPRMVKTYIGLGKLSQARSFMDTYYKLQSRDDIGIADPCRDCACCF